MDKTTEACKVWGEYYKNDRQFILKEIYEEIMKEVKYFGTNNCKCITEEKLNFIFRQEGLKI